MADRLKLKLIEYLSQFMHQELPNLFESFQSCLEKIFKFFKKFKNS